MTEIIAITLPATEIQQTSARLWGMYTKEEPPPDIEKIYKICWEMWKGTPPVYFTHYYLCQDIDYCRPFIKNVPFSKVKGLLTNNTLYKFRTMINARHYHGGGYQYSYVSYGSWLYFTTGIHYMHFKAYGVGGDGNIYYGDDMVFQY